MKKKIFSRELTFGVIVITALFLTYFGLNFLKGINIFAPTRTYYAQYAEAGGLVASTPVYVKGYKVGQVDAITYDFTTEPAFTVQISIQKDIRLPKGTVVELFEDGLMGGKAIRLVIPTGDTSQDYYAEDEFIESRTVDGLMGMLTTSLLPSLEAITHETDSLLRSLRAVVENPALANTLVSAERAADNLAATSASLQSMMVHDVPQLLGKTDAVMTDILSVSNNLKQVDFQSTFTQLDGTVANLYTLTDRLNNGEGSLGLLLNDRGLYHNLLHTASSADSLLIDLRQHPKRYVHFSLFGGKK